MSPTPLHGVETVERIEFAAGLAWLQAMLHHEVRVLVSFRGTFGGCRIEGQLSRVYSVPPDQETVEVLIDDRQGLLLDPIDTEVLRVGGQGELSSLEFHLPSGVAIRIEQA